MNRIELKLRISHIRDKLAELAEPPPADRDHSRIARLAGRLDELRGRMMGAVRPERPPIGRASVESCESCESEHEVILWAHDDRPDGYQSFCPNTGDSLFVCEAP